MRTFNEFCTDWATYRRFDEMAQIIEENNLDLMAILDGTIEDLIRLDPEKGQFLVEQGFWHSVGKGLRTVGQHIKGGWEGFKAGLKGDPQMTRALQAFLHAAQQMNFDANQVEDAIMGNLQQQRQQAAQRQQAGQPQGGAPQGGAPQAAGEDLTRGVLTPEEQAERQQKLQAQQTAAWHAQQRPAKPMTQAPQSGAGPVRPRPKTREEEEVERLTQGV